MEKKLYRIKNGRMLVGVCGGFAEYFNLDPTIVRAIWALVSVFAGAGVVAYIICAFIVPEKPDDVIDV